MTLKRPPSPLSAAFMRDMAAISQRCADPATQRRLVACPPDQSNKVNRFLAKIQNGVVNGFPAPPPAPAKKHHHAAGLLRAVEAENQHLIDQHEAIMAQQLTDDPEG